MSKSLVANRKASAEDVVTVQNGRGAPKSPSKRSSSTISVSPPSSPQKTPKKKSNDAPGTPTRKKSSLKHPSTPKSSKAKTPIVTPTKNQRKKPSTPKNVKKKLDVSALITPAEDEGYTKEEKEEFIAGLKNLKPLPSTVKSYGIVNKLTGKIGGNAEGGEIYGEQTIGSMQKVVEVMKKFQNLNSSSRFIDVGAGLGKPNIHVACDPQVSFSYGIEINVSRWHLSLSHLIPILRSTLTDVDMPPQKLTLEQGDIFSANTFDPFTHVYMFDIGMPDVIFDHMSKMFNEAESEYLVSYQPPRRIVGKHGFKVELICQMGVKMHGSAEGHTGYFYKRLGGVVKKGNVKRSLNVAPTSTSLPSDIPCDPLFAPAWSSVLSGTETVLEWAEEEQRKFHESGRSQRVRKKNVPFNV
ncbi:hypothetical protein TrST_g1794 [Triparma strigata]|uniref:DOT1 domain-containing protein n=1 Tax=Triparma strigata TaxID=1606541 RepID=A0A9W7BK58_9STRA|nr:hypothetical protein TrST_g1794 [Triparma strigata]